MTIYKRAIKELFRYLQKMPHVWDLSLTASVMKNAMHENRDMEIVSKINRGDVRAFEELYSNYYTYLCTVATRYVFSPEAAQEIVNDVFLNVWNNRVSLLYPVSAYMVKSVRNRCINHIQRAHLKEVPLTDVQEQLLSIQEQLVSIEDQPLAFLEDQEQQARIRQAVYQLPKKCRDIFVQYLYYNKTYEEISELFGISNSTVRVQVRIALTKLREMLTDLLPLFLLALYYFFKNN